MQHAGLGGGFRHIHHNSPPGVPDACPAKLRNGKPQLCFAHAEIDARDPCPLVDADLLQHPTNLCLRHGCISRHFHLYDEIGHPEKHQQDPQNSKHCPIPELDPVKGKPQPPPFRHRQLHLVFLRQESGFFQMSRRQGRRKRPLPAALICTDHPILPEPLHESGQVRPLHPDGYPCPQHFRHPPESAPRSGSPR